MCQAMHQLMFVLFLLKRSDSLQCLAIIIISVTTKNKEMNNQIIKGGGDTNSDPGYEVDIQFSHVHLYVDRVCEVSTYKEFEDSLNLFQEKYDEATENEVVNHEVDHCGTSLDVDVGRRVWQSIISKRNKTDENNDMAGAFASHGRDVVRQLIAGFGFRITGCHANYRTNSVVVTSKDPNGIQIVVSAMKNDGDNKLDDEAAMAGTDNFYHHFAASNITRFYQAHSNRQGIAVMAFEVGHQCLEGIFHRYDEKHPELVPKEFKNGPVEYDTEARIFEVFAYYKGERGMSPADEGTMLRFIEPIKSNATNTCKLPGIVPVNASFSQYHPAFFDHWVSNVISRTGFLDTLEDTLYFTPKVDFNAGVVAAGEAQIESTVTGNTSSLTSEDVSSALSDQSQIYLPINNALTKVGHVHGFLEEIGQGVQHVASRVDDIISFVQEANDRRKVFGEGFTFLNIPRSYYGVLTKEMLRRGIDNIKDPSSKVDDVLTSECAHAIFEVCAGEGVMLDDSSVDLDMSGRTIQMILDSKIPLEHKEEYLQNRKEVVEVILHSRYVNMYNLLKNHLSEKSYVAIVRNQILVDVQTDDLLFQIFTSNILQRKPQDESPFFEFIQRVCSQCKGPDGCPKKIKPGCGGFGIRNFLTLFLSIEVTKAMLAASNAKRDGEKKEYEFAKRKVQLFTDQLNESNPLLTDISEAMTKEGVARDNITLAWKDGRKKDAKVWEEVMEEEAAAKSLANDRLMECNNKYQRLMRRLRESQDQDEMV